MNVLLVARSSIRLVPPLQAAPDSAQKSLIQQAASITASPFIRFEESKAEPHSKLRLERSRILTSAVETINGRQKKQPAKLSMAQAYL
jgi:hypothetical protein